jgi:hypothetical protein
MLDVQRAVIGEKKYPICSGSNQSVRKARVNQNSVANYTPTMFDHDLWQARGWTRKAVSKEQ